MVEKLAFPLRIDPHTGSPVTVTQGSDAETAQVIGLLARTRVGERELCPAFGTSDPAYVPSAQMVQEIAGALALFGPRVRVTDEGTTPDPLGRTATVSIGFTTQEASS